MQPEVLAEVEAEGFAVLPARADVLDWARAARRVGIGVADDPDQQARWLRHDGTWFVGVDALPTDGRGGVDGVAFPFADWLLSLSGQGALHPAQLSVTYPGYPGGGAGADGAGHTYRVKRAAAHVDGLLKTDAGGRVLGEPHAMVVGIALTEADAEASPLIVWPGSHRELGAVLAEALPEDPALWPRFDLAPAYAAARRKAFDQVIPRTCPLQPGEVVVLHRHLLHGIAPWADGAKAAAEGRMTAYFRPCFAGPLQWRP